MKVILYLLSLLSTPIPSLSEFRRFDGLINAASNYVHYSEGYIVTPGYVDVSNLVFESVDDGKRNDYVPEKRNWDDDAEGEEEVLYDDNAEYGDDNSEGDDGGNRLLVGENDDEESAVVPGSTVSSCMKCFIMLFQLYLSPATSLCMRTYDSL